MFKVARIEELGLKWFPTPHHTRKTAWVWCKKNMGSILMGYRFVIRHPNGTDEEFDNRDGQL